MTCNKCTKDNKNTYSPKICDWCILHVPNEFTHPDQNVRINAYRKLYNQKGYNG